MHLNLVLLLPREEERGRYWENFTSVLAFTTPLNKQINETEYDENETCYNSGVNC